MVAKLRGRSDRLRQILFDGFHTGNKGGRNRTHSGDQNAEFSFGWFDFRRGSDGRILRI